MQRERTRLTAEASKRETARLAAQARDAQAAVQAARARAIQEAKDAVAAEHEALRRERVAAAQSAAAGPPAATETVDGEVQVPVLSTEAEYREAKKAFTDKYPKYLKLDKELSEQTARFEELERAYTAAATESRKEAAAKRLREEFTKEEATMQRKVRQLPRGASRRIASAAAGCTTMPLDK